MKPGRTLRRATAVVVCMLVFMLAGLPGVLAENPENILSAEESYTEGELIEIDDEVIASKVDVSLTEEEKERLDSTIFHFVSFFDLNGELFYEEEVPQGGQAFYPEVEPELEGFVFVHWYYVDPLEEEYTVAALPFDFDQPILSDTALQPYFVRNIDAMGLVGFTFENEEITGVDSETGEPTLPSGYDILGTLNTGEDSQVVYLVENNDPSNILLNSDAADSSKERLVTFEIIAPENIHEGDEILLQGILVGLEDATIQDIQWQYSDGNTWVDIPGAKELAYSFTASEDTINRYWRLNVRAYVEP